MHRTSCRATSRTICCSNFTLYSAVETMQELHEVHEQVTNKWYTCIARMPVEEAIVVDSRFYTIELCSTKWNGLGTLCTYYTIMVHNMQTLSWYFLGLLVYCRLGIATHIYRYTNEPCSTDDWISITCQVSYSMGLLLVTCNYRHITCNAGNWVQKI